MKKIVLVLFCILSSLVFAQGDTFIVQKGDYFLFVDNGVKSVITKPKQGSFFIASSVVGDKYQLALLLDKVVVFELEEIGQVIGFSFASKNSDNKSIFVEKRIKFAKINDNKHFKKMFNGYYYFIPFLEGSNVDKFLKISEDGFDIFATVKIGQYLKTVKVGTTTSYNNKVLDGIYKSGMDKVLY